MYVPYMSAWPLRPEWPGEDWQIIDYEREPGIDGAGRTLGMQLPGGSPGGAACHAILRPALRAGRAARDAIRDIEPVAASGFDVDQRARGSARHGPYDAR